MSFHEFQSKENLRIIITSRKAYSMSNVNIETCRQHWESDERWALKKEFLKTFQHRFHDDRLLCLAEIYVNVQRLHCSYPAPLMTQIKELAKELNHRTALQQTRKAQQNILFVKEGGGGNPVKRDISQGSTVHPHVKRVKSQNANTSSKNFDINSNQRAVSNINKQLHVSEDNDLSVCTNQTPIWIMETMKPETTNNSSHLDKSFSIDIIAEKLKNIKIIASHIRPYLQKQKGTHWDILHRVCMKSGFSLSCNIVKDSNIEFTITIQVLDVILAKATAYVKKFLRNKVAKKALEILLSAFKIVSDGEYLILKKDEDLTATSNTDRLPGMSKNSNDLDMRTNLSPIPISETTKLETANRCFQLNQPFSPDSYVEKLEKIRKIASQIHPPTQNKKWRCWQLLHDVCMKSDCSLSCNITSSPNPEFVITLKVLDVILSKVTHSDKKLLKYEAAKKAVEILRHSAFKIVSDEQNLILKEDEEQTETSDTNEQPVVSKSNNDSGIHINETPTPIIEAAKLKTADCSLLNEPFSTDIYVEKLEEIKKIASQLYPFKQKINKKWTYWHLLHDACMKSGYSLSYNITTVQKPTFTITLKIFDVILSKVTHSKNKLLKAKAANMAVQILHSAFKIVSDGENLILEKGDEQTVVTNPNEELCMLKGDSDPYVSTNQSPKPRIKSTEVKTNGMSFEVDESSSTNNIIADKLNKLKMIAPKIRPEILCSKNCELKCLSALQSVCQKLHYPFSCVVIQNPNSQFTSMFKVLDVILSQVTDFTKNALKSKAAKKALETLLYFTFKIVYNGENLILKVDEEHAATSNTHTEPSMLKDGNNPGINTNQSPISIITTAKAETNNRSSSQLDKSSSTSDVFADKLNKIKMIAPQIHPHMLHEGEWKYWAALQLACAKLNYLVSWDIIREQNLQFTITVKVLDVILSKVTDFTRKLLKAKAGKKALELLLHSSVKIVSDGENLMLKVDEEDEEQAVKLSESQIEQPDLKPLFPLMPTCVSWLLIEQNGQTKNFPLDPSLQHYFCILDSSVSFSSSPVCVLVNSAKFCKIPLRFDLQVDCGPPVSYIYDLFLKDHKICSASSPKKTEAKDLVCRAALDSLSKVVYTIKINNTNLDASIVLRHQVFDCPDSPPSLAETNIGCKLLKKMGWSGGGIGKEGNTGIVEPIKLWIGQSRGQGLGYSDKRKNPKANKAHIEFLHAKISSFLLNYTDSNTLNDLVFAADFSAEEKKYIHMLASKYNLKSVSRGCGEAKRVSIERRLSLQELLDHLKKAGGPIGKYTLITPQQYVDGYPEDTST